MDLIRLKALIDMVSGSTIAELEVTEGGQRVRITKQPSISGRPSPPSDVAGRRPPPPPSRPAPDRSSATDRTGPPPPDTHAVTSPMFGIFHHAPSPDAPPYVQPGSQVRTGDTLCLIEAMKSFSAVTADRDGTVNVILVEDGQEVEPGQALIQIGP